MTTIAEVRRAALHWPWIDGYSTKVRCPDCGVTGYRPSAQDATELHRASWVDPHREHATAACGKVVTVKGLRIHESRCRACADGHLCRDLRPITSELTTDGQVRITLLRFPAVIDLTPEEARTLHAVLGRTIRTTPERTTP